MQAIKWFMIALACLLAAGGSMPPAPSADEAREAYDRMVEEATREADAYLEEKTGQSSEATGDPAPPMNPELARRVQAERARIETEMEKTRQRGLGPNFTIGMKDNRLKELQDQLDRLQADPAAYFAR